MLSPEYVEIKDLMAKFTDAEVEPLAADIDKNEKIPEDLVKKLAESGFMGSYVPEEYDGAGMDYLYAILVEELSRGCASTGVLVSAHTLSPLANSSIRK